MQLIFIFLMALARAADSCSTIADVAKGTGLPFDQYDSHWCHAHTATLMLTQKLQRMKVLKAGERLHPLAVGAALQLANKNGNTSTFMSVHEPAAASDDLEAVRSIAKYGIRLCREKEMGSTDYRDNKTMQAGADETLGFTMDMANETHLEPSNEPCLLDRDYEGVNRIGRYLDKVVWWEKMRKNCKVQVPKLDLAWAYRPAWSDDVANGMQPRANPERQSILQRVIDDGLAHGALVAVNFNPDFIKKEDLRGGGMHWISAVARQRDSKGTCRYKLKNSWGQSCDYYAHPGDCEKGYIWVSREELVLHADSAQFLR